MKNDLVSIEIEGQHIAWLNELNSYNSDIERFEHVLEEMKPNGDALQIEHFQNQFLIQKRVIASLKNEIKKHALRITRWQKDLFQEIPQKDIEYHERVKDKINTQNKLYKSLKFEFETFLQFS